jgi:hypothetical protein
VTEKEREEGRKSPSQGAELTAESTEGGEFSRGSQRE